jgi:RNA polymerase sigma-70 factor (ECF subfamily)
MRIDRNCWEANRLRNGRLPKGGQVPQSKVIAELLEERRDEMVKYAGAVSGDEASAEDLVQEAWLRCNRAAKTQTLVQPARLLWRILRNLSIDRGRRIAIQSRTFVAGQDDPQWESLPDDRPSVEDMLIAREELALIQRVMDAFDPRTRAAFELHRFEGAKLREIAQRLGISVTTAHGLVAEATRRVRAAARRD